MSTISTVGKYLTRQAKQIATYGEKSVERTGVTENILCELTPFRRLSNKKGVLSDSNYFIKKFETETGNRFLPQNWSSLSTEDKLDYIVKDRYSKLVSHKIMGKIKDYPEEHLYLLNKDGDIVHYSKGDMGFCDNVAIKGGTSIHNHPGYLKTMYSKEEVEYLQKHHPEKLKGVTPFSEGDINTALSNGEKAAYVIDSQGHKFLFKPRQDIANSTEKLKADTRLAIELKFLGESAFPNMEIQNAKIHKTNESLAKLEEFEAKQKKWGRLFYSDKTRNRLLENYLNEKTDALSMEPFEKINKELKELSEKYGHKYEQLS